MKVKHNNKISQTLEITAAIGLLLIGITSAKSVEVISGSEMLFLGFIILSFGSAAYVTYESVTKGPTERELLMQSRLYAGIVLFLTGVLLGGLVAMGRFSIIAAVVTIGVSGRYADDVIKRLTDDEKSGTQKSTSNPSDQKNPNQNKPKETAG